MTIAVCKCNDAFNGNGKHVRIQSIFVCLCAFVSGFQVHHADGGADLPVHPDVTGAAPVRQRAARRRADVRAGRGYSQAQAVSVVISSANRNDVGAVGLHLN